jgi:hypothetical protein
MLQEVFKTIAPRLIILSFATTGLLGVLNESEASDIYWTVALIPVFVSLILMLPHFHMFIVDSCSTLRSNSLTLILILVYCFILSLLFFSVFLGLKADDFIQSSWYSVFIPLWFAVFIGSIFTIFMLPGMLDPAVKLHREAWSLLSMNISVIISSILLAVYLNDELDQIWVVFLPLIVTCPVCLAYLAFVEYSKERAYWIWADYEFCFYVCFIALIALGIANDTNSSIPDHSFFTLILVFCGLVFIANEVKSFVKFNDSGEEGDTESAMLNRKE